MSDSTPSFFANLPGFDFLKSLSSAQTASLNPWLKPTLDPKELDQRIQELKTVHFWLEQNAKALAATIQALEVQRMTLSTLQQMNVDWKTAMQPKKSTSRSAGKSEVHEAAAAAEATEAHGAGDSAKGAAPEAMRLWTNLANQFGQIAQQSMTDMQRRAQEAVSAVGERVSKTASSAKSKADQPATSGKSTAAKSARARTRARKT